VKRRFFAVLAVPVLALGFAFAAPGTDDAQAYPIGPWEMHAIMCTMYDMHTPAQSTPATGRRQSSSTLSLWRLAADTGASHVQSGWRNSRRATGADASLGRSGGPR
jgi:hypothetical protein